MLARIPVGNDPHEVIASTDGKTAYVSNYGFGAYNTLAVIDLAGKKALPAIDLGPSRAARTWPSLVERSGSPRRPPRRLAATIRNQQSRLDSGHGPGSNSHDLAHG